MVATSVPPATWPGKTEKNKKKNHSGTKSISPEKNEKEEMSVCGTLSAAAFSASCFREKTSVLVVTTTSSSTAVVNRTSTSSSSVVPSAALVVEAT